MIQNEYIFTKITTTKFYYYFILAQLALTLLLTILVYTQSSKVYVIETILTVMLTADLFVKYLSRGAEVFWTSWANRLDCGIACFLFLLLFVETLFRPERDLEQFSTGILIIRYGIQAYRMSRLLRQEKESREIHNLPPIDLYFESENIDPKAH